MSRHDNQRERLHDNEKVYYDVYLECMSEHGPAVIQLFMKSYNNTLPSCNMDECVDDNDEDDDNRYVAFVKKARETCFILTNMKLAIAKLNRQQVTGEPASPLSHPIRA